MAVGSGLPVRRSPMLQSEITPVANISFEAAASFQEISRVVGAVESRFLDKRMRDRAEQNAAQDAEAGQFQQRRSLLGALTQAGSDYDEIYNASIKAAYLSRTRLDARTQVSEAVRKNPENMDALRASLDGIREGFVNGAAFDPAAVQDLVNQEVERAYTSALNTKQARIDADDEADLRASIADSENNLAGLARSGAAGSDEYNALLAEIEGNIEALRADPRFNVSDGEAELMRGEIVSKLSAEASIYGVVQVYQRHGKQAAEKAARQAFNDPDLELSAGEREYFLNRSLGEISRRESEARSARAEMRAKAAASVDARMAAAARGQDGSLFISDAEIMRVYGEDAPAVLSRLEAANQIYADQTFIAQSSPADVAAEFADRQAAIEEALQAGDAERYAIEATRAAAFQTAVERKREAFREDPVGYLEQLTGASGEDVQAMIERQRAAGALPGEVRVMSNAASNEIARQIAEQPDGLAKGAVIQGVKEQFGDQYRLALADLADAGVPEAQIIGATIQGAADARAYFQSFDIEPDAMKKSLLAAGGDHDKIEKRVNDLMRGFRTTLETQGAIGGAEVAASYENAVRRLASVKIMQGDEPSKAVKSAYEAIVERNYAVVDTIRAPRLELNRAQVSERAIARANNRKKDILSGRAIVSRESLTLPEEGLARDAYVDDVIKRGYFATLPDESGVMLFDAEGDPVTERIIGGSRPVTLTWDQMALYGSGYDPGRVNPHFGPN